MYHVQCRENLVTEQGLDKPSIFKNCEFFLFKAEKYETTCILHESFTHVLENYLMIVRPDLQ
jgi:hypothetical protein